MLNRLPRCLARMLVARSHDGLLKKGGLAGRKSWGDSAQQVGLSRSCPVGGPNPGPTGPEEGEPTRSKGWAWVVSPFGLLKVCLPCHVLVGTLDPHKYPDADRVLVTLRGMKPGSALEDVQVKYDQARNEVMVFSEANVDSTASLEVKMPLNFDLDLKITGKGCVKIEQIECTSCKVETEKGTSILQSIKSSKIDIRTKGGNVVCRGTLQGNSNIHVSEESSVSIGKLQGSSVNISSGNGLLEMKYLYADSSFLSSAAGDILLGNIHGDTILETKSGNIRVDSSEGSLKASTNQGNIDAYILNQTGEVDLNAQEGYMDQKNGKGTCIKAETQRGNINLKSQSWFQSVKLKIP